jgi:3-phenylpropionate/trans-cinnamate dioxygenase ferredoxin subunit
MTATVRGVSVAPFNVEETVHAIDDTCRHAGVSLGAGVLRGAIVRCRAYGWRYVVTTGHMLHDPGERVTRCPVQVVEGTTLVDVT